MTSCTKLTNKKTAACQNRVISHHADWIIGRLLHSRMWCALLRSSVYGTPTYYGSQNSFQNKRRETSTLQLCLFFSGPLKKMARCHKSLFWHLNLKKTNCRHKSAGGRFPTHTNMLQNTAECFSLMLSALVIGAIIGASLRVVTAWSGGQGESELQKTFLKNGSM